MERILLRSFEASLMRVYLGSRERGEVHVGILPMLGNATLRHISIAMCVACSVLITTLPLEERRFLTISCLYFHTFRVIGKTIVTPKKVTRLRRHLKLVHCLQGLIAGRNRPRRAGRGGTNPLTAKVWRR